jgi:hypothetical protein
MEKLGETVGSKLPMLPSKLNAGLIVTSLVIFIITAAFNGLAGSGAGVPDIFYSSVTNISVKYELYITPAGWFRVLKGFVEQP